MSVRKGFRFVPKFIKPSTYNGTPKTSFSIGDKIKGANNLYQNYNFTVWGTELDLSDGDTIVIEQIDDISANFYNGKTYLNISGKVTVQKQGQEDTMPDKIPEVYTPLPNAEESFTVVEDTTETLPFDL